MRKGTSKYLPFEEARELIRQEVIASVIQYAKWHKHNKPRKIPLRPDIVYRKRGWISWNDFLGNNNKFIHAKKNFLPYDQAKKYSRSLGFTSLLQWREHVREGKCPANIPRRPDFQYKEWFTWKDWLGKDLKKIVADATKNPPVLYVIKTNTTPNNVFKVNVTFGGREALVEAANKGARIIAAFDNRPNFNWRLPLSKYATPYIYGEADDFMFSNMNGFLFEVSAVLQVYR